MGLSREKIDRRIIKTKRAIFTAMIKLMAEKDINKISVKEVADSADINRKTFYNYYTGVYQLVDEIENGIVEYFSERLKNTDLKKVIEDPSILFDNLHETINKHIEIVEALFASKGNSSLIDKVVNKLIEITSDEAVLQFKTDPSKTETIIRFIFSGEIAVYQAWYHSGKKCLLKNFPIPWRFFVKMD